MSALTDKIEELAEAAQRYEDAHKVIQVLHDAVAFAHQEVKDILEGNVPAAVAGAVEEVAQVTQEVQATPEPEAQPEPTAEG